MQQGLALCWQMARGPFLAASLFPAFAGGVLALVSGTWRPRVLLITVLSILLLHIGANLWNDFQDHRCGADWLTTPTPYSGGSRVIQERKLSPAAVRRWGGICLITGGLLCVGVCLNTDLRGLLFLAGGLLAAWGYSAPPLRWCGRGLGEVVVGLAFGPLLTCGVFITQTGALGAPVWFVGSALGFLVMNILCLNEIPDRFADNFTAKQTWAVRWLKGLEGAAVALIALAYITVAVGVLFGQLPASSLLVICLLPLAIRIIRRIPQIREGDLWANSRATPFFISFAGLLMLGISLGRWLR